MLKVRVVNRSGYDTRDLERFFTRALRAAGVDKPVTITVVPSPIYSRGCAEVGGSRAKIAIAAPSHSSLKEFRRRLARLLLHEAEHLKGAEHEDMCGSRYCPRSGRDLLYSTGATPSWARDLPIRFRGRARAPKRIVIR